MKKTKKHKPEMHLNYNADIGAVDREYALEHLKIEFHAMEEAMNITGKPVVFEIKKYHQEKWNFTVDEISESNPEFSDVVLD